MANAPEIVEIALRLKPHIVCLVPERRQEVTTEGGLDVAAQREPLKITTARLQEAGIEVSLFVAPDLAQIEAASHVGADFVELHTGPFAEQFHRKKERADEVRRLKLASEAARAAGIQVNAGHGLNYQNVAGLFQVPHLVELNIGHSIVSRSITVGLATAVKEMLVAMQGYADGQP
jgi:pyridoxine 5-phosphate synthase